ncbi:MAG: twin-arginine translocation signal domain-containing protein, partial [Candidatus Aminicenantes bacterium]|nr:twin-arginine translocation signal domain-containing protein [Candidatus Aminicenantes bacterium]
MKKIIKKNISRRDFIKNSALGVVGVAMSGELLNGEKVKAGSSSGLKKSSVVVVRH